MPKSKMPVDLRDMAYKVMITHGFKPDLSAEAQLELHAIENNGKLEVSDKVRDLRHVLWSSIDNSDSKDLDQIEYAERMNDGSEDIRLLVGIADVDCFVPKDSAIDQHARDNCSSVYTGVIVFPMLPELLSNDRTSLLQDVDRQAVIVDMVIGTGGETKTYDIYLALVRNQAKLVYDVVADWLDNGTHMPILDEVPGLAEQLHLQNELCRRIQGRNQQKGAISVQTLEARPVAVDGQVVALELTHQSVARDMIQSMMVSANSSLAKTVKAKNAPMIQRVVKKPVRWNRLIQLAATFGFELPAEPDAPSLAKFINERKAADPEHFVDLSLAVVKLLGPGQYVVQEPGQVSEGHFGLAVHDYTHATAPNRRFADLVTQRVTKALALGNPLPYTVEELKEIASRCEEREEAERKVERTMRKAAAATLLSSHIGEEYDAIVTGIASKGTFARLLEPPAEGRVVANEQGLDVGDKIRVRLTATEPALGFIDFVRII
jgi:VacB/RNase II family 3'-5' exoribonuclease